MTVGEYYDQLERHDWYYEWSDDHGVWERGSADASRLKQISEESPEHKALWDGFNKHKFSGESWGTEKQPKPERPT